MPQFLFVWNVISLNMGFLVDTHFLSNKGACVHILQRNRINQIEMIDRQIDRLIVCYVDQVPFKGEIIWYLSFTSQIISLSKMLSSSIHTLRKGRSSFFLSAVQYSIVQMYHSSWIHSFTDRRLGCCQHLATVNSAVVNTGVHRFF